MGPKAALGHIPCLVGKANTRRSTPIRENGDLSETSCPRRFGFLYGAAGGQGVLRCCLLCHRSRSRITLPPTTVPPADVHHRPACSKVFFYLSPRQLSRPIHNDRVPHHSSNEPRLSARICRALPTPRRRSIVVADGTKRACGDTRRRSHGRSSVRRRARKRSVRLQAADRDPAESDAGLAPSHPTAQRTPVWLWAAADGEGVVHMNLRHEGAGAGARCGGDPLRGREERLGTEDPRVRDRRRCCLARRGDSYGEGFALGSTKAASWGGWHAQAMKVRYSPM